MIIELNTIEDIQKIGNDPNYPLTEDYILTQDIDATETKNWNNGKGFIPIGFSKYKSFSGSFDGKNYKIKNLYINIPQSSNIGLFSSLGIGASIKNINLEYCYIRGKDHCGILMGKNTSFTDKSFSNMIHFGKFLETNISNCNIINGKVIGKKYIGLLGGLSLYSNTINCNCSGTIKGEKILGGIYGLLEYGTISDTFVKVNITGKYCIGEFLGIMRMGKLFDCRFSR